MGSYYRCLGDGGIVTGFKVSHVTKDKLPCPVCGRPIVDVSKRSINPKVRVRTIIEVELPNIGFVKHLEFEGGRT